MKTLTNESKARFFAHNIGQVILDIESLFSYTLTGINCNYLLGFKNQSEDNGGYEIELSFDSLILVKTPLQNISDEHKVWCMHRANEHIRYDQTQDYGTDIEMANHLIENEGLKSICFLYSQYQYLQSKGYALDYYCPIENRIIPVQEQIDNGWITLKEE